ncbi:hypothetical protein MMC10_003391 [Thelotrema lepadinum]|nr:hypothetical protein [Thelotrema lepadinum]
MADDSAADDAPLTFSVKSSNDAKYTITMPASSTVSALKEKLSTKDFADLPVERQRLIYSGRVLKDADTLGSYKIKEGNTVHLVKGAASNQRQNPANQGAAAVPSVPANLSAGTGNDPLAGLTGARYAGFAQLPGQGMFGPDGGMGPPPDPEDMIRMLQNPQFASTLNEALSNPQLIDTMIQQNPVLREMGPQVRQMMQTPEFRRMMTDPEQLRSMMQMQRMFGGGGGGMGGLGGAGGNAAFPAPGATDTTQGDQAGQQPSQGATQRQQPPAMPFGGLFGQAMNPQQGQGQAANPFAALFNPAMFGNNPSQTPAAASSTAQGAAAGQDTTASNQQQQGQTQTQDQTSQQPSQQQQPPDPFAAAAPLFQNPQFMNHFLNSLGGNLTPGNNTSTDPQNPPQNPFASLFNPFAAGGAGGGGGGGLGGFGAPQAQNPPDTRPPEERFETQLGQLNEMGFYEFERNVEALRRTGGSVQGAIEYLLSHP